MTTIASCWLVTDGRIGIENEALGLAEALGVPYELKRVAPRPPWRWLPPRFVPCPLASLGPAAAAFRPPWPDLLIACGRQSVAIAAEIKRRAGAATFAVFLQNPRVPTTWFDLVVPPLHDHVTGPNVIETRGAIHRVTPAKIAAGAERFRAAFAHLARPLVAVMIGGASKEYKFDATDAERIGRDLARFAESNAASLLVTMSRRTGEANAAIIRKALDGPRHWVWDGQGENPYFGMLGLADAVVATVDSIAMTSEAASTGKPVYVMGLRGERRKFVEFHARLQADGMTRPFDGRLDSWTYPPLDDTGLVAKAIRARLGGTR
jgi:mitochondrial fission protein ELM1